MDGVSIFGANRTTSGNIAVHVKMNAHYRMGVFIQLKNKTQKDCSALMK